jgi:hypothetical protein
MTVAWFETVPEFTLEVTKSCEGHRQDNLSLGRIRSVSNEKEACQLLDCDVQCATLRLVIK